MRARKIASRNSILLMILLLVSIVVAAPAQAAAPTGNATVVWLRIEGSTSTIFEAPIITTGHDVTTAAGGTHHCDGTNNNANPTPGPTAIGALDDAARVAGFTWDGPYFPAFDDYLVSRIAGTSQTATQFWSILRNGQFIDVGGCQQQVQLGDQVLFAFDAFGKAHLLKLTGPLLAKAGQQATYHVSDLQTGTPVSGATVKGGVSNANGDVSLTFGSPGVNRVKAERADSIRSNSVVTVVTP